jgi:hypothetical protein
MGELGQQRDRQAAATDLPRGQGGVATRAVRRCTEETVSHRGAVKFDVAEVWVDTRSIGDTMVAVEGVVQNGSAYLEHEVSASRRPAHLLLGIHSSVQ